MVAVGRSIVTRASILLLALGLLAPAMPAPAASTLEWSNASSPGGGTVWGLGGSAAVLVASTTLDGTFRSFDNGLHWERIDDFPPVSEARSIRFDPGDPLRGYVAGFGGVARTTDGGHTWQHVLDTFVSYRLDVSPTGAVVASAREESGRQHILKSLDGGDTWSDLGAVGEPWGSLYGLSFGRSDEEIVASSISRTYVTHDAGAAWTASNHLVLDLLRDADGDLWRTGFDLQRSTDGGLTWSDVAGPTGSLLAARPDGGTYVVGHEGLALTLDDGATWETLGFAEALFGATIVMADPHEASAVLFSDEFRGVTRLGPDADGTWLLEGRTTGLAPVPILGLGASPDGSILLAGGTLGLYLSRDAGDTWAHTGAGLGMIGVFSAAASADNQVVVAGGQNRIFQPFVQVSRDGGRTFNEIDPLDLGGDGVIRALAFAGESRERIYAAAHMDLAWSSVLESSDGGRTWEKLLSTPGEVYDVAWDSGTGRVVAATDIGVLVHDGGGVWKPIGATFNTWGLGTGGGRVYSSGYGHNVWRDGAAGLLAPWADTAGEYVVDIAVHPRDAGRVLATADGGSVHRCADAWPVASCADASVPGERVLGTLLNPGGRAFAATERGVWSAHFP